MNFSTVHSKNNIVLVGVILLMGLAAMMAGLRIVESQSLTGQALFEAWATDWLVIWASASVALFAVLLPLIARFKLSLQRENESDFHSELMRTQPSLRQEMMAMQSRDFESDAEDFTDALEPLGGLQVDCVKRPDGYIEEFEAGAWNTRTSLLRLM